MIALAGVWIALASLVLAVTMVVYRPAFTDPLFTTNMYGCTVALTCAGLVLWGTRKDPALFEPVRLQAKVAIGLAVPAVAILYMLIHFAEPVPSP